ncbi:MAG: helix-turn-helix domain-containing protein [Proteobacteria bacterium]|nr:helix-turn-helix domain-containing protein [Pseudomonadota bacterium]
MKLELEEHDLELIVDRLFERLKPMLPKQDHRGDVIFDKKELSQYLKVGVSWIDNNLYMLPHFKVGKYVRFRQSHIDQWIKNVELMPSPYLKLMKNVR